jgi:hypothetical protein
MPTKKTTTAKSTKPAKKAAGKPILGPDFHAGSDLPTIEAPVAKKTAAKKAKKQVPDYSIYEIQLTLLNVLPKIWRRLLLPGDMAMAEVHEVIQFVMGWEDCHMHQFVGAGSAAGLRVGPLEDEDDDFGANELEDEADFPLDDLVSKKGSKFTYEYDFGDGWEHLLEVKAVHVRKDVKHEVSLLDGAMACPPEDCGGSWGYMELLAQFNKPKGKRNQEIMEMVEEDFDPTYFDLAGLEARIRKAYD